MRSSLLALLLLTTLTGCGAASTPTERPRASAAAPLPSPNDESVVHRAALDEVLEGGPGLFLQRVGTEPDLRDGRFVGFRLTELRDTALFEGIDLAVGDTIVAVNGRRIERPEDAFTVWTSLRVASELSLSLLRGDEPRELRFAIVD